MTATPKKVLLDDYRNVLIRQEETIIFSLIERAQFLRNAPIYRKRADATASLLSFKGKYNGFEGSFLEFMLSETERLHALNRRYTSPDEHAFFPSFLPDPILPPLDYQSVLIPNTININDQIMSVYLEKLLPHITHDSDDHTTFGSSANADIAVLQALSKRIHFGKFIAEAKFQAETKRYTALILANDAEGIMDALTNLAVEDKVVMRVRFKASTYGQDIVDDTTTTIHDNSNSIEHCKVDPQVIADLYRNFVMPLTKQVQVAYLLQRLHHPSVSFVGPVGSFAHSAAVAHFANQRNFYPVGTLTDVFASVVAHQTAFGLVAFEDSQVGISKDAQLLLIASGLVVTAETVLQRPFVLATSSASVPPADVTAVYMPASAEAGFGLIVDRIWSGAKVVQVASVDEAARCAQRLRGAVAVTTADAAKAADLHVLDTPVDLSAISKPPPALSVRFLVVGRSVQPPTGNDKTCLCVNVKHEVGSLLSALQVFKVQCRM
ncbi:chorismate mutase, variant [Aphanomyces astaci]|uniref:chorismate mutase n=1 Tax=Aphanomyces astaci TaxID=112090 RepID=W4GM28_APHAT|nr:chorismate mutase, variant [Aphanomyces astaci]ETV80727.1 chorismate mutase, variant [Aphanomyces astaci]|eukprot:XP_009829674.1 chorismate mutase, variant [Aphanomyces astaci]